LRAGIESLGVRALATQCDVAQTEAVAEMVKVTKEAFGRIDFLVNNASITRDNLILWMKEDAWDAVLDTNLKGLFLDQMSRRNDWLLGKILIHAKKQMRHHLRHHQQTLQLRGRRRGLGN
jgi:NAD(P)-dependent dehydrogenase (short-subunit alcohol dehydrogenase family)